MQILAADVPPNWSHKRPKSHQFQILVADVTKLQLISAIECDVVGTCDIFFSTYYLNGGTRKNTRFMSAVYVLHIHSFITMLMIIMDRSILYAYIWDCNCATRAGNF